MKTSKSEKSPFSYSVREISYKFLSTILLALVFSFVDAQPTRVDSLKSVLSISEKDSERIIILNELVNELISIDLKEALSFAQNGVDLSRNFGDKKNEVNAIYKLGLVLDETSERDLALKYFEESEQMAEKMGLHELQSNSLMRIAKYHRYVSRDSIKTVDYLQKSVGVSKEANYYYGTGRSYAKLASFYTKYYEIELCESYLELAVEYYTRNEGGAKTVAHYYNEVGNKIWEINPKKAMDFYLKGIEHSDTPKIRASLAKAYSYIGDHDTALRYLKEVIPHFRKTEKTRRLLGIAIAQLAEVYIQLGNYSESKKYCDEGITLLYGLGRTDQRALPALYRLKGIIAESEGDDELALKFYTKSLDEAKRIKVDFERIKSTNRLGMYYASRDPQKGKSLCQISFKDAKRQRYTKLEIDACDCLYNIYKQEESYLDALNFYEQKILLSDTMSTLKVEHALVINSKIVQKDQLLAEQVYQKEIKDKENRFQRIFIGFLLFISLLGLVFIGFLMHGYRRISGKNIEIKEESDQLEILNQRLEKSNEELERFAHITSHDLKTPLRNIISYTGLLRKNLPIVETPIVKDSLNLIEKNGKRMNQLINDVLDYSKLSSQVVKKTEPIDLGKLLEEISQFSKNNPDGKSVNFEISELPTIHWHSSKIFLLFKNIIENGIKYNESDLPEIKIYGLQTKAGYTVHFEDNGIGIEKEYYDKIFVMFNRLHNQTQYEGTGLGLAVCKKIVNELEGNLTIESEPGQGTTFIVNFPNHLVYQSKEKKELLTA